MIEKFMILMIQELGPTGLLIIGLYLILGKHIKKLTTHVATMNHNSTKMIEIVERCADRICDKLDKRI